MLYIVLTPGGLENVLQSLSPQTGVLWINAGVANTARMAELRADGWNITTWTRQVNFADPQEFAYELATIREHHPGHVIWMEQIA